MNSDVDNIGLLILAAGKASRMGFPKQLLTYSNTTLLEHVIQSGTQANVSTVSVVLGAYAEQILARLKDYGAEVIINKKWEQGMASSICCGIQSMMAHQPPYKAIIIAVADQPGIAAPLLNDLIEKYKENGSSIVYSKYKNGWGTPALFSDILFQQLMELEGDKGAKQIILKNLDNASLIDFPEGDIDIDTIHDYKRLKEKET